MIQKIKSAVDSISKYGLAPVAGVALMGATSAASYATGTNPNNDANVVVAPAVDYSGTFNSVTTYGQNILTGPGAYSILLMMGFLGFRFVWRHINGAVH